MGLWCVGSGRPRAQFTRVSVAMRQSTDPPACHVGESARSFDGGREVDTGVVQIATLLRGGAHGDRRVVGRVTCTRAGRSPLQPTIETIPSAITRQSNPTAIMMHRPFIAVSLPARVSRAVATWRGNGGKAPVFEIARIAAVGSR